MTKPNLKLIAVSTENYLKLKRREQTADSFNDVITELLKISERVIGDSDHRQDRYNLQKFQPTGDHYV